MSGPRAILTAAALTGAAAAGGCWPGSPAADVGAPSSLAVELSDGLRRALLRHSPLPPPPPDPTNRHADDPAAAHLGRFLFFDERLSGNGMVSCATCHDARREFTDGLTLAEGVGTGRRHTPTLWNVAHHRWLTWDGRADSLWMQALDPIEDPVEMGGNRADVARLVLEDEELRAAYADVFGALPDGLEEAASSPARPARRGEEDPPESVARWASRGEAQRAAQAVVVGDLAKAIAAYQRTLLRDDAPFDRFVEGLRSGDEAGLAALSPEAQRGMALFFGEANCVLCHSGPNFSDGEFHNNALPTLHGGEPVDAGRYDGADVVKASPFNAAGHHSDAPGGEAAAAIRGLRRSSEAWGEFRTPSLRNLSGRAPFMHQGQLADLAAVLEFYSEMVGTSVRGHHQEQFLQPLRLHESEKAALKEFLGALNGAPAGPELLEPPSSPRFAPAEGRLRPR
ncbi:MAG: cytochrome c peroxidase [Planctomycetota bacterium]|nr:cytochrome c peroxidase [Planctomycetota bacterium]